MVLKEKTRIVVSFLVFTTSKLVLLFTMSSLFVNIECGQPSLLSSVHTPSSWILRNRESVSRCALIEMTAFFEITYQTSSTTIPPSSDVSLKREEKVGSRTINLTLDSDASLSVASDSHECLPDDKGFLHLDLSFGRLHNLVLLFRLDGDHYQLYAVALEYTINRREFPGHRLSRGVTAVSLRRLDSFRTPLGMSYSCKAEERIRLDGMDQVIMVVKDLKFEIFNPRSDMKFSPSTECDLDVHSFTTREIVVASSFFLFVSTLFAICFIRRIRKKQRAAADVLPLPDKPGFTELQLEKA